MLVVCTWFVICFYYQCVCLFFFFNQKTAYEMRISDWSSDVCSSDLGRAARQRPGVAYRLWEAAATAGMPPFDPPEILESDLSSLILEIGRASCRERVCQYV